MANRQIYNIEDLHLSESFVHEQKKNIFFKKIQDFSLKFWIYSRLPIIKWLPEYIIKKDLPFDLIAGVTVAILQIPQSIAYGFLANVPPICGIYCAFFGSIVYAVFGTSKHISVGVFAVVCLMVGKTVATYSKLDEFGYVLDNPGDLSNIGNYKNTDILVATTFIIAFCQLIIFFLRLGMICNLLSGTLINAFSTACCVHIIVSQLQEFFGLRFKSYSGYFRNYHTLKRFFSAITTINYVTFSMGVISLIFLIINTEIIKPWLSKKCRFPMPMEIIVVTISILLSFTMNLEQNYEVKIVKNIPKGIPSVTTPNFEIFYHVFPDAVAIALVSYIISQSINMIFARKGNYAMDANQEAFAMALMNFIGCFFLALPVSTSLVRSHLQYNIGGVSQIAAIITALILLIIILWVGPVFEYLPKCILSSVVLSAVYKAFFEITRLKYFWKLSKIEGLVWIISFLTVVIVDISIGIFTALILSVAIICVHTFQPDSYVLGNIQNTEIYLDLRYKEVQKIPDTIIFHYTGSLNYYSKHIFQNHLFEKTNINPNSIFMEISTLKRKLKIGENLPEINLECKVIILDFSGVSYVDSFAIENLQKIQIDYNLLNIELLICNLSGNVFDTIKRWEENQKDVLKKFLTIHDAVLFSKNMILNKYFMSFISLNNNN